MRIMIIPIAQTGIAAGEHLMQWFLLIVSIILAHQLIFILRHHQAQVAEAVFLAAEGRLAEVAAEAEVAAGRLVRLEVRHLCER